MEKQKSSISIQTLAISAAAAVAAAVIVPLIWERGTLVATAMTPVIVALVSEVLRRPAERISTVAPKVTRRSSGVPVSSPYSAERFDPLPPDERAADPPPRRAARYDWPPADERGAGRPPGRAARYDGPAARERDAGWAPHSAEPSDPLPPEERGAVPPPRDDDPFGLRARRGPAPHHWRLALATGAAAFVIAVVFLTMSELVLGGAATREGGRTTFFSARQDRDTEPTPTATPSATEEAEPEPTPTATPTATARPAPTATATPIPTATPPPAATRTAPTPAPTP
jgi:hypothetical protein